MSTPGILGRYYDLKSRLNDQFLKENMLANTEQQLLLGMNKASVQLAQQDPTDPNAMADMQNLTEAYKSLEEIQKKYKEIRERIQQESQKIQEQIRQVEQAITKNHENTFGSVFTA